MKTSKQINVAIESISRRSKTWREDVQGTLIDIAGHMVQHGEASLGLKLLNSVGNGANKVALAKWFVSHTAFRMKGGKPTVDKKFVDELTEAVQAANPIEARNAHENILAACPMWFEDEGEQVAKVRAVFDALTKAELFMATLTQKESKGEGSHLDFGRYLRTAIADYKKDLIAA